MVLPSDKPCKYYGIDREQWIQTVVKDLKKYTNRPIIFREKPQRNDRIRLNNIYDALNNDVYATVTYNSIAAVESVVFGLPTFTLAPSAADCVSNKDLSKIETPYFPEVDLIEKWKRNLAYNQFHIEEIINGTAWDIINEIYCNS